ncbi:NADH:flavin oxidoreductase/NADH oxidase [Paenibacillus sp. 2TAB19]|uniref:NADH:flavin oxidoreductase/NADH oxidase n=1 Tax=Paenibacillus sp. 2TAB19 TaxID=3233003 RepID=UPI003F96EE3E
MSYLNVPFSIKGLQLNNSIVMAPMCQYSVTEKDGKPNDWHYVHYLSRAVGGTGLILMEMTDVEPDGRITDQDLGLWSDEQIPAFKRIIDGVHSHGSKIGIQIAHAGRKALDAEVPVGPSELPYDSKSKKPRALTTGEVKEMVVKFREAVRRAIAAGVDTIELHGAHGYLIHQFHSPGINNRTDEYGKQLSLFGVEVIRAVKSVMPSDMPLIMRISAVEYMDGGYELDHSIAIAKDYMSAGVDVFHVSSGGDGPIGERKPGNFPGYQLPLAKAYREALSVPVIAVGQLEDPIVADAAIESGDADLIAVARGMLRDPYWATHAIQAVGHKPELPEQYKRAY